MALVDWAFRVVVTIAVFYFGSLHFRTKENLRKILLNYDVTKAQLSDEDDREFLLSVVDDLFTDIPVAADIGTGAQAPAPPNISQKSKSSVSEFTIDASHRDDEQGVVDIQEPAAGSNAPGTVLPPAAAETTAGAQVLTVLNPPTVPEHSSAVSKQETCDYDYVDESLAEADPPAHNLSGPPVTRVGPMCERPGIVAFNHAVKTQIPRQLPTEGLRSWKVFGYMAALLAFGYQDIVITYDLWAWNKNPDFPVEEKFGEQNFRV